MGTTRKTIEECLASSIKDRVSLYFRKLGPRGYGGQRTRAMMLVDRQEVLCLQGAIYCKDGKYRPPEAALHGFTDKDVTADLQFVEAIKTYTSLSIDQIVASSNPVIRAIGMLDARLGKRRLCNINVRHEAELVRRLFALRCECEGLPVTETAQAITTRAVPKYTVKTCEPAVSSIVILSKRKRSQDVRAILADASQGTDRCASDSAVAKMIIEGLQQIDDRQLYIDSLNSLMSLSKLVREPFLVGLNEMLRDYCSWIRPLATWMPRTHNAEKQFASLARHLFAKYDVPPFMDQAWLSANRLHQSWFKLIGSGQNIRTAPDLPIRLTKMMAHHFLTAPAHYPITAALRWGQLLSLGADQQTADAVAQTRLSETFVDDDFWMSVFRFFIDNPMLDPACIGPIVDYIWNQKYESVMVFVARGVAEGRGPAQPNFSMKGRTAETLLAQMERWHHALGKRKSGTHMQWAKSPIRDFQFVEGSQGNRNMKIWRISELLSTQELVDEGRQMKHCVASYAHSCHRGDCSIWSMTLQTAEGTGKMLTIEVRQSQKSIRQVRGRMNRLADTRERQVIQRWAAKEGLSYP